MTLTVARRRGTNPKSRSKSDRNGIGGAPPLCRPRPVTVRAGKTRVAVTKSSLNPHSEVRGGVGRILQQRRGVKTRHLDEAVTTFHSYLLHVCSLRNVKRLYTSVAYLHCHREGGSGHRCSGAGRRQPATFVLSPANPPLMGWPLVISISPRLMLAVYWLAKWPWLVGDQRRYLRVRCVI